MQSAYLEMTILDWQKFNPRTDSKSHSWFRFENSFFTKTFSWSAEEQRLFQYICCVCSQEKKADIKFDVDLASALLKRKPQQIREDLETLAGREVIKLSNLKLLQVTSELPEVTQSHLVPTNVRTDERTNEHRVCENLDGLFEKAWEVYPLKVDKGDAKNRFQRLVKTESDANALIIAIPRYTSDCDREKRKYKHFATFLGTEDNPRWREWVNRAPAKSKQLYFPPPESLAPDPRVGPLKPEIKNLLDLARGVKTKQGDPTGAA